MHTTRSPLEVSAAVHASHANSCSACALVLMATYLAGAPGTSKLRSSTASFIRANPFASSLELISMLPANALSREKTGSTASSLSTARQSACLTTSWWKCGMFTSRRHRRASTMSSEATYSASITLNAALAQPTVPTSAPPHTRRMRSAAWRAPSSTSAVSVTTLAVPLRARLRAQRSAGASTSSTTARARKRATSWCASTMSSARSSAAAHRSMNPSAMCALVRTCG
mmetsp:Transcript_34263/g.74945  ORF Transcript_34263/g.74945 Transcript_34263/m.74945 type:complete len:228 (-) Transcript_34263:1497-2180(-)